MEAVMERRVAAAVVLGVAIDATEEEIKRAYLRAVKVAHPDAGGSEEAFQELTEAVETLAEPLPLEAAAPKPEVAPAPRSTRPELGPLRVGLMVFTPPLAAAVVIVAYVLAPGVGIALIVFYVVGLVGHVVYVAAGQPSLWRLLRSKAGRE
jgi:hypothetical protein